MRNDKILLCLACVLCFLGLVAIYSVDPAREAGWSMQSFFGRQFFWNVFGWSLFIFFALIDYRVLVKLGWLWYFLLLLALGAVLVFGESDETGARRWIFSQSVQPSEFAKIILPLFLSFYLSKNRENIPSYALLLKSGFWVFLPVGLIFLEPDLGTSLVLLVVWLGMLFISGFGRNHFALVGLGLGGIGAVGWSFLKDYQKERLFTFLDPWKDPLGSGYNVLQSQIAIGAGGLGGQGWLSGKQSQLRFLPARHTDFIFASWCEQMGFLGGVALILLLGFFIWIMIRIARHAPDLEGKLLASLFGVIFVFQVLVNVGMNMGVMPVTGIPLPFVSYGGSALVVNVAIVGLLYNIANSGRKKVAKCRFRWDYQQ